MKLRTGFVANSSSSDYILPNEDYRQDYYAEWEEETDNDVIVYLKKQMELKFENQNGIRK